MGKNNTSNKTMVLHKYTPDWPNAQFTTSNETSRRILFE